MVMVQAPELNQGRLHKNSLEGWGNAVNNVHTHLSFQDDSERDFSGVMATSAFGELRACRFTSTALTASRTKRDVSLGTEGTTIMLWQFRGTSIARQASNEAVLSPGTVAFLDLDTPYEVRCSEGYGQMVIHMPSEAFLGKLQALGIRRDHRGMSLPANPQAMPWLAFLGAAFSQAQVSSDGLMNTMYTPALEAIASIAGLAVGARIDESNASLLVSAAERIIRERYWDSEFTADALARELCVSRRTLFRAFDETQQSFSQILQEVRLSTAAKSLAHPAMSLTLEGVGRTVGYSSASTFYARFREKFGVSPGAYRRRLTTVGTVSKRS